MNKYIVLLCVFLQSSLSAAYFPSLGQLGGSSQTQEDRKNLFAGWTVVEPDLSQARTDSAIATTLLGSVGLFAVRYLPLPMSIKAAGLATSVGILQIVDYFHRRRQQNEYNNFQKEYNARAKDFTRIQQNPVARTDECQSKINAHRTWFQEQMNKGKLAPLSDAQITQAISGNTQIGNRSTQGPVYLNNQQVEDVLSQWQLLNRRQ